MTRLIIILLSIILLAANVSKAQSDSIRKKSNYSNDVFLSVGYNHCKYDFFDAGIRYYHTVNDGQTIMAFAGTALGCEFSINQLDPIYIPYVGWQGQYLGLGYGLRAEYPMNNTHRSFSLSPELGFSLFELLRITGGYRLCINQNENLGFNGFRFSLVAALPLSLLNK